jgi:archaeal flagellar protein FlaJ
VVQITHAIYHRIAEFYPGLKTKLLQAELPDQPEEFIRKTVAISGMMSFGLVFLFIGGMLQSISDLTGVDVPFYALFILFPFVFIMLFSYLIHIPDAKIAKLEKEINREIVFATRFIIIEVESGVPMYNAFINVSKAYPVIGRYYGAIVEKVNLGTSMDEAISDATEIVPSNNLRKVFWQILNSIKTGADVTTALQSVLQLIIKEQKIEVEEYGRKLNPMAMFYMLLAVIVPSLGITMLIIFASFMGITIDFSVLILMVILLGLMQFMFYAIIKSSRPAVEL